MNPVPFALLLILSTVPPLQPGNHSRTIEVGGLKRTYHVHVPPSYDPKKPTPVVLALHGAGMNGTMMKVFTGLDKKADEAGFIVVYPDGTGVGGLFLVWNAGSFGNLGGKNVNDVAFMAALLDDLAKIANVDAKRVCAAGMSNGAMMAYRLAAELSERIAAIAPVAGTMVISKCEPKRPVSVIHFHGTKDALVPFGSSERKGGRAGPFRSVDGSVEAWVKANGCKAEPETTVVADGKEDGLKVTRKVYGGGKDDAEVTLYVIDGGGHTWPGTNAFPGFLGGTTLRISANDLMWDFFRKHPIK
jgi:polyhydroxybutyrate depolymerase